MIGNDAMLPTVSAIMMDKRVCELQEENKKLKETVQFIKDALTEKCGHVWDLVWYARSRPEEKLGEAGRAAVREKYPEEVKKLQGELGNWQHGFNSSCLAVHNMITSILEAERVVKDLNEMEEDFKSAPLTLDSYLADTLRDFPMMDT